jgi:hypothetical protein
MWAPRCTLVAGLLGLCLACEGRVAMKVYRDGGSRPLAADAGQAAQTAAVQCPAGQSPRLVETGTPIKLDLLFMIDDSPSMAEEQANLARNFPRLIEVLEQMPAGLPDLHLGVVSSDMGAGNSVTSGNCATAVGDRGVLQVRPGCGLDPAQGRFLVSEAGGTITNFTGDIAEVFACLAELGTNGCGYEHQLQAVRVALSGFVAENSGFLRGDAHLAVVYITDEDDCSAAADSTMYGGQVPGQDSSLRCALAGHLCDGAPPPAAVFSTPLANCSPAPDGGGKLLPVQTFIDEMKRLRTQSVSVSVIGGWPDDLASADYAIGYDDTSLVQPDLLTSLPICKSANGSAAVGLRMKQLADAFGSAGKIISICQDDFSNAMAQIGQLINTTVECQ